MNGRTRARAMAGLGAGFCAIAYPSMMADAADEHEQRPVAGCGLWRFGFGRICAHLNLRNRLPPLQGTGRKWWVTAQDREVASIRPAVRPNRSRLCRMHQRIRSVTSFGRRHRSATPRRLPPQRPVTSSAKRGATTGISVRRGRHHNPRGGRARVRSGPIDVCQRALNPHDGRWRVAR